MHWLLALGAAALVFGLSKQARAAVRVVAESVTNPPLRDRIRLYRPMAAAAARSQGIPERIIAAWAMQESSWKPNEYNAEPTAMARWACEIAGNKKWAVNPDFGNAVQVCETLRRDPSKARAIAEASKPGIPYEQKAFKFGSFGLMQLTAISARTDGFPYSASNRELLNPKVNLDLACKKIARLRDRLYPGRRDLSEHEWSQVRAAYVGGPGVFDKAPETAARIAAKFRERLATTA